MEILIGALILIYFVLLIFGFKSTWSLAVNSVLAGSSEIVIPILIFILMILVVGPIMGIVNLVKVCILQYKKSKIDQNQ